MSIGRMTGYHHSRRIQRMTRDSSIRPTGKSEIAMGIFALGALLIPFVLVAMILS